VGTDDTDGGLLFVGGTDNIERKRGRRRRRERAGDPPPHGEFVG
jgi:hypothetical protein